MFHDDQSVFGPTMEGVVNPRVPHAHPYPTRYHGGVWTTPVFGQPYRSQSYMAGRPGYESQWLQLSGAGPDGLGEPLLCSSSGSTLLDAALGGAVGYIAAPKGSKPEWWAAAGASATALAGLMGAVCVVGAALLSRSGRKLAVANRSYPKWGEHLGQHPEHHRSQPRPKRPKRAGGKRRRSPKWGDSLNLPGYLRNGTAEFDRIRAGDTVYYVDHRGQDRKGRAVMEGPHGWVLNLGGRHGTPAVVGPEQVVRVRKGSR